MFGLYYLYYWLGYDVKPPKDIMCVNSFFYTNRPFNYVVEIFETDDDEPTNCLYDRIIYNH